MADCNIRIATPEDVRDLAVMHVAAWRETYAGILPDKMLSALSVEARTAAWAKIMGEPATERSTVIYLAEHDAAIIGFGSCGAQRTESLKDKGYDGEVSGIYVLKKFQKRGVGGRMFGAIFSDLKRRGFSAAALWVLHDNLAARRFYEHFRGEIIAERDDVRDGTSLVELAYGWTDLKNLNLLASGPPGRGFTAGVSRFLCVEPYFTQGARVWRSRKRFWTSC
jgi:ribosomal protein S18 acetylase RimI-like enzyme